ncbi:ribonuclease PH [Oceanivirga miroungae]|uniref:Ribonuclease PH n=1 Tax=Oceanivirga miroungae TaxID=1130046 RepID=A0A6I8M709_9FUSO|nr:ribonuclease PH [Oceanivirga miroungae]VWL85653.1 ribonuclease PH [Oceanivirga miroungae]
MRKNNRKNNELRELKITENFTTNAMSSILIEYGNTKVLCTASIENKVPLFLKGQNRGWLTAEYQMLPTATEKRTKRESQQGKQSGRTVEIQRLIGRSLRAALDFELLGEKTITIDCDVLQADGGTRTASITGGYLALEKAIEKLLETKELEKNPLKSKIAAVSVGKVNGEVLLDLDYSEDSIAEVDMNIIMNNKNEFIEIQGTGEGKTFVYKDLLDFIEISKNAFDLLFLL